MESLVLKERKIEIVSFEFPFFYVFFAKIQKFTLQKHAHISCDEYHDILILSINYQTMKLFDTSPPKNKFMLRFSVFFQQILLLFSTKKLGNFWNILFF
jgi:hypothetical protein